MTGWAALLACVGGLGWAVTNVLLGKRPRSLPWVSGGALAVLWGMTAVVLVLRFTRGIGFVSALSDRTPWGVWISLDVLSGVALAAGGFVIAATVHIFHIERFEAVLRPTILTAFLGYILVAVSLLVDIGRPYRIWHPLVMWQHHSIMFEVAWCVTLYTTVLALEFSPILFERLGLELPRRWVRRFTIPIVILGVILSTLHQSSLGTLFLIVPQKMHPLWYSPLLPVFFLISSVAAGMCMIIVESYFSSKLFQRSLEVRLLSDFARSASFILFLYGGAKIVDLVFRAAWRTLGDARGALFLVEMGAGVLLPAILLSFRRVRRHPARLFGAALLAVCGIVFNRLNVSWFGMFPASGASYFPSWMELTITVGIATAGAVVFGLAVRFLPVFPPEDAAPRNA